MFIKAQVHLQQEAVVVLPVPQELLRPVVLLLLHLLKVVKVYPLLVRLVSWVVLGLQPQLLRRS